VTYLEQVAELHDQWQGLDAKQLAALEIAPHDAISRWARDWLAETPERTLTDMLEAATQRSYSANPDEGFFTGGGLHHFDNFEPDDDHRTLTVAEATARSVNLVYIRLMRDVVRHVMARSAEASAALLEDRDDPRRREYLARFADNEGRTFVARFWRKYAGKKRGEAEEMLLQSVRETPSRLASAYYGLEPEGDEKGLARFLAERMPDAEPPTAEQAAELHERYRTGRWSLADRGYLAGVHPLELWVVGWLRKHPEATLTDTLAASKAQRQDVYEWLFKTRHKDAQDSRIRGLLEIEAFLEIHRAWKRLGYPFESLTPSYASALGASGDRPAALAELMGILVNDGVRQPVSRIGALQFATGTPYETQLEARPAAPERVMKAEVAAVARRALISVVETGTAKRLKGALTLKDGTVLPIGGKTGTGDHRFDVYGRGGKLLSSRVVSRSATLVFLLGDRFFGTIMAYAREPDAEHYKFTSALPSQLLKSLVPTLLPLIEGQACVRPAAADKVEQVAR
jgi:membrane peptidoglycan carboxypeptidase